MYVWFAGDFNAPDINWKSACIETGSIYPTIQTNLIQDHGLSQVVMEPTRCGNILDSFFTNSPGQVQMVKILPELSDHDIVSLQINCKPTILIIRQKLRQILLLSNTNWEAFRSGIISFYENISNIDIRNIHTLWAHFHDTLIDLTAK